MFRRCIVPWRWGRCTNFQYLSLHRPAHWDEVLSRVARSKSANVNARPRPKKNRKTALSPTVLKSARGPLYPWTLLAYLAFMGDGLCQGDIQKFDSPFAMPPLVKSVTHVYRWENPFSMAYHVWNELTCQRCWVRQILFLEGPGCKLGVHFSHTRHRQDALSKKCSITDPLQIAHWINRRRKKNAANKKGKAYIGRPYNMS